MAEKKSVIDFAYPGDIVGLHDTGNFKLGATFTEGEKLKFTGIPSFAPEQFRYIENADPLKFKQLAKGIDQLMDEGVAQLFTSSLNGRKIIGTVGALLDLQGLLDRERQRRTTGRLQAPQAHQHGRGQARTRRLPGRHELRPGPGPGEFQGDPVPLHLGVLTHGGRGLR